jgi:hypothetical protein
MDRRAKANLRQAIRAGALALAGFCAGCANLSDPAAFATVTQDKFDFNSCKEIAGALAGNKARVKQYTDNIEKADASPGGFLVSAMAYRTDLVNARAMVRAAERAAEVKGCNAAKKP